jgi:hypothetical protein
MFLFRKFVVEEISDIASVALNTAISPSRGPGCDGCGDCFDCV